eukprot:scaffold226093_cov31-Tisochrysis_lutea.AAC.2
MNDGCRYEPGSKMGHPSEGPVSPSHSHHLASTPARNECSPSPMVIGVRILDHTTRTSTTLQEKQYGCNSSEGAALPQESVS